MPMKKAILILLAVLAAQTPLPAHAGSGPYSVLLAGGTEANMIHIWLTADGRSYVIDSIVTLEVGGSVCVHPPENSTELICQAAMISGFEVNAAGGDDQVKVAREVAIPVTIRGGGGNDLLIGGGGPDKLIGGDGDDRLIAWGGADLLSGGPGDDALSGGLGDDVLRGGSGNDILKGGPGSNDARE